MIQLSPRVWVGYAGRRPAPSFGYLQFRRFAGRTNLAKQSQSVSRVEEPVEDQVEEV
jgi:hypothetical protein